MVKDKRKTSFKNQKQFKFWDSQYYIMVDIWWVKISPKKQKTKKLQKQYKKELDKVFLIV